MRPQSLLLAAEHVPHFINLTTRSRVVASYRQLHRNLNLITDPLARQQLKLLAQHSFARFKYISNTQKIEALLNYAEIHEFLWLDRAVEGNSKDLFRVLEIAYTTYGVKETPLKQVISQYRNICDQKAPHYKLNNISVPSERSFDEHRDQEASFKSTPFEVLNSSYWQLVKVLKKNHITTGKQKRKLFFQLEDMNVSTLTVLGRPIAKSRQKNTLKRLYSRILRDAPRPVHPDVLEYLKRQLDQRKMNRQYLRRYKELGSMFYTVTADGKMLKINDL